MKNQFWDIIKSIYIKQKLEINEYINNSSLIKTLARDRNNLQWMRKCLGYEYYLEGEYFYYLLYCNSPSKTIIPYLKKIEKIEEKDNKLLNKIKDFFNYSNKELNYIKTILIKLILKNELYWKQQLGMR